MPSSVQARRVRIRAMPAAIATPCLGLYAVRLRARGLGQVPTGLGRRNARAAYKRCRKHNDAENLPHRGLLRLSCSPPEAELAGPAPEATHRAYRRSVDRSVPTSELSWVRRGPVTAAPMSADDTKRTCPSHRSISALRGAKRTSNAETEFFRF